MADIAPYASQEVSTSCPPTSERGISIDAIVQAWLHAKGQKSHSAKTQQAYEETIYGFRALLQCYGYDLLWRGDNFLAAIADFAQTFAATRMEGSRHKGDVSSATQSQRLSILSSFYRYAAQRRHSIAGNPIDLVERASVEPYAQSQAIDQGELARKLDAIDISKEQGIRDLALLSVLLSTGRRVSEIASLTRGSVQLSGEQIRLSYQTKGKGHMRDLLTGEVSYILSAWLSRFYEGAFWGSPDDTPVWVNVHHESHRGEKLGYHGIAGICKHYLGTSKVHTTRHSFAILMEAAGAKLTDIQQRLGHKNAATTGIYMNKLTIERNTYAERIAELLGLQKRITSDDTDHH